MARDEWSTGDKAVCFEQRRRPKRVKGPALVVPGELQINGGRWIVEFEPPKRLAVLHGVPTFRMQGIRGVTFPWARRIQIAEGLDDYMREMVLVHELLHACFPVRKPLCKGPLEEKIVTTIAPVLLQILKQCRWKVSRAKKANRVRGVRAKRRNRSRGKALPKAR